MRLAVVQISDIHIRDHKNPALQYSSPIAGVVRSLVTHVDACLVAVTGDIAFSGLKREYELARPLLDSLVKELQNLEFKPAVAIVGIPGNHDCDFSGATDLRPALLQTLPAQVNGLHERSAIIAECLSVQAPFFDFFGNLSGVGKGTPNTPTLWYDCEVSGFPQPLRVRCLNTAWCSQKDEIQGQLMFPVHLLPVEVSPRPMLSLTLLHHPLNWLEAMNARTLRAYLEQHSDVIFTGHEHDASSFVKKHFDAAQEIQYVEGAALCGPGTPAAFNLTVIDTAAATYTAQTYAWHGDHFATSQPATEVPFVSQSRRQGRLFQVSQSYFDYLTDPGAAFSHPRVQQLRLEDIFIYPDVLIRTPDKALTRKPPEMVRGSAVCDALTALDGVLVIGGDSSGKTALAKTLYKHFLSQPNVVPLLLDGRALTAVKEDRLSGVVHDAFKQQYSGAQWGLYGQQPASSKVLIVDDFHLARYNDRGFEAFVKFARTRFGKIVLFGDDVFHAESLTRLARDQSPLSTFAQASIRPFGHRLRGHLIHNWVQLGREYTAGASEIAHEVSITEQLVSTLLGKNLLPSYPVTVLMILQTAEAGRLLTTATGSHGYVYEALLTDALTKVSIKGTDIDTLYAFLSHLAFVLFQKKRSTLSDGELDQAAEGYFTRYSIRFDHRSAFEQLKDARILQRQAGGTGFKYRYGYYYFVARHISSNIGDAHLASSLRELMRRMANAIYSEENANILIFYLYLTRDRDLIDHLLGIARRIYDEHKPCELADDVEFINRLYTEAGTLELPETETSGNLDAYRTKLDEQEDDGDGEHIQIPREEITYSSELNDILKINIAFKTLQVIGQVLRNFSGTLTGDIKLHIARESYLLGLRTLKAIFHLAETNLTEVRQYYAQLIRERRAVQSLAELAKTTDELLIYLTLGSAFSIIKRVSEAVGLERLSQTYQAVLEEAQGQASVAMIDVSVKLDHFSVLPVGEIEELLEIVKKNPFSYSLLRDLVAHHLYLFPVDVKTRQRLGAILDIRATKHSFVDNPSKMLKLSDGT